MKFFSNRIYTKAVSIQEAAKHVQEAPKVRSLDELLSDIGKGNQVVKTASTNATVKTAEAQAPQVAEAPKAEAPKVAEAAAPQVQVKTAELPDFIKEKMEKKDGKAEEKAEKKDGKAEEKAEKKDEKDEKKGCPFAATANKVLKVAKKLDFRGWNAEDVVKAWGQHGSLEKCMANVKASTSDAKLYCGLLQVASQEAEKVIKTAAVKVEAKPTGVFKKIAKLTDKEKSFLTKYWGNIYGDAYVKAMMENY